MNIFIFNKGLRCIDNTTLIEQTIHEKNILPIFIFTEQVNQMKNKYFSHNSVQFMVESLKNLADDIKNKYNGKLYLFHSDNFLSVLKKINKDIGSINSIGTNYDYSPYARTRQKILTDFCQKNDIKLYIKEDHVLYNILEGNTLKKSDNKPYTVFTPFRNYCYKNLTVNKPDNFNNFHFTINQNLNKLKYYISIKDIDKFYIYNPDINVNGGRDKGLQIIKNHHKFVDYLKTRDIPFCNTTFLSAHNHFGTVSIREVYKAFKYIEGIINELHWRDYYYNLYYYFPHMLSGQINSINKPFKPKFDNIKWKNDMDLFEKWCNGTLGIPLCDAGMRQLNLTGFMHNRLRMLTASVLTKLLLIDWRLGEKYFARNLVDYDCIQNNGGWAWTCTGVDPKQIYRIFNPKLQSIKIDKDAKFIKKYIPELTSIPVKSIHNWESDYKNFNISYPAPQINYKCARSEAIKTFRNLK